LARWEKRFQQFTLVTQNIDGLHQKQFDRCIELHGNLRARCVAVMLGTRILAGERRSNNVLAAANWLRPDVVLFGEMLPGGVFELAAENAQECETLYVGWHFGSFTRRQSS